MAQANLADIYEQHRRGLFALALSITGCPVRAEDAVHDAFARICRGRAEAPDNLLAYVFTAVRNAALDQVRRVPASLRLEDNPPPLFDFDSFDPQRRAMELERQQSVARAVETLPAEQRETVILRIYAGLSFAEIADVTSAPLPTVATRYRRALQRLKRQLENVV